MSCSVDILSILSYNVSYQDTFTVPNYSSLIITGIFIRYFYTRRISMNKENNSKDPWKITFGKQLKKIRKQRNYKTQRALAEALCNSRYVCWKGSDIDSIETSIKRYESGNQVPKINTIISLCDFLHCDMDYLFGRISEPTHDVHFISEKTGLNEDSVEILMKWNKNNDSKILSENGLTDGYSGYIQQTTIPPGFFYGAPAIIALNNLLKYENLAYSLFEQINKYINENIVGIDGSTSIAIKSQQTGDIDCIDSESLKSIFLINIQNILSAYIDDSI